MENFEGGIVFIHFDNLFCSEEEAKEKIFYSYTKNINGFAAFLEEEEAVELASKDCFSSLFTLFHIYYI